MKILHILASNKYSGAENVVCQIINLFNNDSNIQMAYSSPDGDIKETLKEKNIEFIPMKKLCISEIKRIVKEYNPDVIHSHDFTASVLSCFINKPIISHIHNNSPWIKKYCLYSFVYGLSCLVYKQILTVSNSVMDEFVFGKNFKNKSIVIGNPISVKEIYSKIDHVQEKSRYDIVFLGRITEPKNPLFFLDIVYDCYKKNKNLKVVMIGDGEMTDEVDEKIAEKGLQNVIYRTGFLKNPYNILSKSRLLCIPSLWEGFGLVAVEALALNKPVVASNVGGLPDIVTDDCGKLCTSLNDYTEEITKLLTDENYYNIKSKKAYKRAEMLDNINVYKKKLYELYNEINQKKG